MLKVGDETEGYCPRCRLNTYQIISATDGREIFTSTCRTCRRLVPAQLFVEDNRVIGPFIGVKNVVSGAALEKIDAQRGVAIGTTVFLLLAGGAVVVDRVAVGRAQDRAVTEIQANVEGVSGTPDVTIGGFPFLTQLAAGKLKGKRVKVHLLQETAG